MKYNAPSFSSYEHQREIAKASGGFIPHPAVQDLHGGLGFQFVSPSPADETNSRSGFVAGIREFRLLALIVAIAGISWGGYSLSTHLRETIKQAKFFDARAKKAENMVSETPEQRLQRHYESLKTDPFMRRE
jgi:hypothetical protein